MTFVKKTSILKKKDNITIVFNVYDDCEEFKTLELPNQIIIDASKIITDKKIYDIGAESYYFFEKKGNYIVLKNINN